MTPPKILVLAVGNPSRGDDAIGPTFIERLEGALAQDPVRGTIEVLTDFQLQIEHSLDLRDRARVFFVDASVSAVAPFECTRVVARHTSSHSTHAISPEAVLETYEQLFGETPAAWLIAIRGEAFELGEPVSDAASAHVDAALEYFLTHVIRSGARGVANIEPKRQVDTLAP